jgi:3-hydroxyisobutyrate dehydrogenase-like beta-hydroxyacid dehydrogenase
MMSTLSPAFCRKVGEVAKAKGVDVLDGPVTGARMRAATGELGIMVGGREEVVEKYRPVLETMGTIMYCGDLGMGEVVKLVNNMSLIINIHGLYEAVAWAIANGAREDQVIELMKIGTGCSWPVHNWEMAKSMNVEEPPVTHYLGAKDLSYALKIAREIGQPCPMASLAYGIRMAGPLNKWLEYAKSRIK